MGHVVDSYRFAAGGLTTVAEDTFTRADSSTLGSTEVGSFAWTEHAGNFEIVSNAVEAVFSDGQNNFATFDPAVSDLYLTANVRTSSSDNRTDIEIAFRASDANNYWMVAVLDGNGGADNGIILRYISGGGYSTVQTYAAGVAASTDYLIEIDANGTSIEVFVDGVSRLSTTNSLMQTNTRVGLRSYTAGAYDDGTCALKDIKVEV